MAEDDASRTDLPSSVPNALLPWAKKPRFSWTPQYEETFFQSLCQSVHMGLRENMSFKAEAWDRALAALREQGAYPTKAHLINKTDNARKKFRLWRGLVENPQFSYDVTTRTIAGSDEAWNAHLEKEPLARAFRDRGFDNTQYLEVLFPDVVGSRGQPKRVTKPRRKGPDSIPGSGGDGAPPGASIMHMPSGPGPGTAQNAGVVAGNNNNNNNNNNNTTSPATTTTGGTPMRLGSNAGLAAAQQAMNATPIPIPMPNSTNTPHHNAHNTSHQHQQQQQQQHQQQQHQQQQQQQRSNAAMARAGAGGTTQGSGIQPPQLSSSMRTVGLMGVVGGVGVTGRVGGNQVNNNNSSASALTPPDETGQGSNAGSSTATGNASANAGAGQKRFTPGDGTSATAAAASSKRRRTEGSISAAGANNSSSNNNNNNNNAAARNRPNAQQGAAGGGNNSVGIGGSGAVGGAQTAAMRQQATDAGRQQQQQQQQMSMGTVTAGSMGGMGTTTTGTRGDGLVTLLSDVMSRYATAAAAASATRWPEQAMDIFFQEFADEDMDLQVRIAEKILTDASKAVMFCKMPSVLRRHWVKRLRDAITRQTN